MKNIENYINETLSNNDKHNLDIIIKSAKKI